MHVFTDNDIKMALQQPVTPSLELISQYLLKFGQTIKHGKINYHNSIRWDLMLPANSNMLAYRNGLLLRYAPLLKNLVAIYNLNDILQLGFVLGGYSPNLTFSIQEQESYQQAVLNNNRLLGLQLLQKHQPTIQFHLTNVEKRWLIKMINEQLNHLNQEDIIRQTSKEINNWKFLNNQLLTMNKSNFNERTIQFLRNVRTSDINHLDWNDQTNKLLQFRCKYHINSDTRRVANAHLLHHLTAKPQQLLNFLVALEYPSDELLDVLSSLDISFLKTTTIIAAWERIVSLQQIAHIDTAHFRKALRIGYNKDTGLKIYNERYVYGTDYEIEYFQQYSQWLYDNVIPILLHWLKERLLYEENTLLLAKSLGCVVKRTNSNYNRSSIMQRCYLRYDSTFQDIPLSILPHLVLQYPWQISRKQNFTVQMVQDTVNRQSIIKLSNILDIIFDVLKQQLLDDKQLIILLPHHQQIAADINNQNSIRQLLFQPNKIF